MFKPITAAMMMLATGFLAGCEATDTGAPAPANGAGGTDPVTGMSRAALVNNGMGITMKSADGADIYGIFYIQAKADPAQLKAAPAKLCAANKQKLVSAQDMPLAHPDTLPGVRKVMVQCK